MIKKNVLDCIGQTNLIYLERLSKKYKNNIYMKDESTNPFGSIKDRAALNMINKAMEDGLINKDTIIIEATSGNTGIGLCGVCAYYKLKCIIVMPENASVERIKIMKAYKAEVKLTKVELGMQGSIELANKIKSENPNSFMAEQFVNENNYMAHFYSTAREIESDLKEDNKDVDYIFAGIGTSGTITGIGKYFKENNLNTKIIGIEPFESAVINGHERGAHGIDGIGAGFIPKIYKEEYIDDVVMVKTSDALQAIDELMDEEGLFVGTSTGGCFKGLVNYINENNITNKTIVFISPDSGIKYLSKR